MSNNYTSICKIANNQMNDIIYLKSKKDWILSQRKLNKSKYYFKIKAIKTAN